jgi:hypothetical protein
MIRLTWNDFDQAVDRIASYCAAAPLTGVYGFPRGGLPLAVALSHRLGAPMVPAPSAPGTLIVDDIHDTGRTLAPLLRPEPPATPSPLIWVWVTREIAPRGYSAVWAGIGEEWVTFPWEDATKAEEDMHDYRSRR